MLILNGKMRENEFNFLRKKLSHHYLFWLALIKLLKLDGMDVVWA